jgi:hypothetical protein
LHVGPGESERDLPVRSYVLRSLGFQPVDRWTGGSVSYAISLRYSRSHAAGMLSRGEYGPGA